jgi:hypothetical protein
MGGATIAVSPAAAVRFDVGLPGGSTAGAPFAVTVTARDPYNNVATDYRGTVYFLSSDEGAVLPAAYTFTDADAGSHTFDRLILFRAGGQQLTVTDVQDPSRSGSGTLTVSPAAAASFYLDVPNVVTAGAPFDLVVYALDAYSNVVTDYTGTVTFFSDTDPSAVLPLTYTFTAADQGVARIPGGGTFFTEGLQDLVVYDTESSIYGLAYLMVLPG